MSIQAISWVLEHSQSTGSARLVLISLANHASEQHNWECWPGMRSMAKEAGVASPETVRSALSRLAELGELEVLDPGGPRRSARYRLSFMDSVQNLDTQMDAASSPGKTLRPVQGGQNRNEPESNRRTEPSLLVSFELTPERLQWAQQECPSIDIELESKRFVNHFKGEGKKKRDWERTWKNWLLKAESQQPQWVRNKARRVS